MNINITSIPAIHESFSMAAASDFSAREIKPEAPRDENIQQKRENERVMQKINEAVTMDSAEVRDFLFMLIGATVEVKPETENAGTKINMMA